MTGLPWYAHNIEKYERKTAHLTMVQHGAYRLMMDHYYKTAAPLPAKLEQVHRICRAVADDEQATVSAVLSEFFELKADGWHNKQADEELAKMAEISGKRRKAAKTGHEGRARAKKKAAPKPDANAGANAETLNTEHISSLRSDIATEPSKKEIAPIPGRALLPNWIPIEAWQGFVEMRRGIGAKLNQRAITLTINKLQELRDAGEDVGAVLDQSTMNSWKSVFPVKQSGGRNGGQHNKPSNESFAAGLSRSIQDGARDGGLFGGGEEIIDVTPSQDQERDCDAAA